MDNRVLEVNHPNCIQLLALPRMQHKQFEGVSSPMRTGCGSSQEPSKDEIDDRIEQNPGYGNSLFGSNPVG